MLCGADTVAAGLVYATRIVELVGCEVRWEVSEGSVVPAGRSLGTVSGDLAGVLLAERPMLNVLQRACGIARAARRHVQALRGTGCRVLHTRKTAPGLRLFDVHAALAGGAGLHRLGLESVVMIKDNHWVSPVVRSEGLVVVIEEARRRGVPAVHVEVETVRQVEEACRAGADRLLIDNRDLAEFAELVSIAKRLAPQVQIEATGGITLDNVRAYAEAGADFVSVGALTHSVAAAELSLEID